MPTIDLKRIQFALTVAFTKEQIAALDVRVLENHIVDTVMYNFRIGIFGQDATRVIRYPRDWWQAVKARWFPAWALRRWPVVETVHTVMAQALLPSLQVPPEYGPTVYRLEIRKSIDDNRSDAISDR